MYSLPLLARDSVVELGDIPQSSVGAPCPMIVSDERHLAVAFFLQNTPENWNGETVKIVDPTTSDEPHAVVRFAGVRAYYHGPPNDEAFSGHPLAKRGLRPYGNYEVKESSWIERLKEMNRAHPHHQDSRFADKRHFILSFHDTTFECVAKSYSVTTGFGSLSAALENELKTRNEIP
jgi:hypothetical protein